MPAEAPLRLRNGQSAPLGELPVLTVDRLRKVAIAALEAGWRLSALFGIRSPEPGAVRLVAVMADGRSAELALWAADVHGSYPALTPDCPQANWFEREIFEAWGVRPEGHPWLQPIRSEGTEFRRVEGEAIHEVAVGPIHAGVIEPGHFRFQCHGERVLNLEVRLGYQHRGVERRLAAGPDKRSVHYAETLSGDTTVGHALAHAEIREALGRVEAPSRSQALRAVALELERLANHTGDLGALSGDVAFLPVAAYCGRIRGDFLNMTALLGGNRFGRGLVRPGGAGFDLAGDRLDTLRERLGRARRDVMQAAELLFDTPSVVARFAPAGRLSQSAALAIGLVGPAARACGIARDVRAEFPTGAFRAWQVPVSTWHSGGVFARAYVRWLEIGRSLDLVETLLETLPAGPTQGVAPAMAPDSLAVSLVEAWRGEICHVAMTGARGSFSVYKVVDPSFHNWPGVELALRDQPISDFPLCNKSFNLSYCGTDL